MKLHLASGNAHKAQEFQALVDSGALRGKVEIVSARALGGMPHVDEDTGTFIGNARKKAVALREKLLAIGGSGGTGDSPVGLDAASRNTGESPVPLNPATDANNWVLADDSGLCVDALGGAPGVESAYFAGPQGDSAANLEKLKREMRGVPEGKRGAHYVCVLFLLGPDGAEHVVEGRCEGRLTLEPRGAGGFGYDPLFIPDGYERTFAELGDSVKNNLSHRGRAWVEMARFLNEVLSVRG